MDIRPSAFLPDPESWSAFLACFHRLNQLFAYGSFDRSGRCVVGAPVGTRAGNSRWCLWLRHNRRSRRCPPRLSDSSRRSGCVAVGVAALVQQSVQQLESGFCDGDGVRSHLGWFRSVCIYRNKLLSIVALFGLTIPKCSSIITTLYIHLSL